MKTLAANTLNDLFVAPGGSLGVSTGIAAAQQCCITAVQAQRGEMVFALNDGIPYLKTVWENYNPLAFETAMRARLLRVAEVLEVVDFTIIRNADNLNYSATIRTTFGVTSVGSL